MLPCLACFGVAQCIHTWWWYFLRHTTFLCYYQQVCTSFPFATFNVLAYIRTSANQETLEVMRTRLGIESNHLRSIQRRRNGSLWVAYTVVVRGRQAAINVNRGAYKLRMRAVSEAFVLIFVNGEAFVLRNPGVLCRCWCWRS